MRKLANTIHTINGYKDNAYTYYPVVIIGAGESGIAMGCRLKQVLGCDQFRIFERRSGLGGTWYTNRYPGIACDIPAICYSFSWRQNPDWTTFHPPGPEIVNYLHDTCSHFKILDKIQLDTDVTNIHWLEDEQEWEVTLVRLAPGVGDLSIQERKDRIASEGASRLFLRSEKARAKVVVSAVGGLVEPNLIPDIPGIKDFQGDLVHTARWDPKIDVSGKDIVVVGAGCSGAQVVPEILKPEYKVKSVTQLLRTPGWVEPNTLSPQGINRWEKWSPRISRIPGVQNLLRLIIFWGIESVWFDIFKNNSRGNRERPKAEQRLLRYMRKKVPEKYHELLTPNYSLGCKRRVIDTDWFTSLNDPRVELTSNPLTNIEPDGVILGPGRHWPPMNTDSKYPTEQRKKHADAIIFANGYNVGQTMFQLPVVGRGGKSLQETWAERPGPGAYLGTAVHGFPNFFMLVGPNTATGHSSIILQTENAVNYALHFIGPVIHGDVEAYEIRKDSEEEYTATIQEQLKDTVWGFGGCNSWYISADGWNSSTYPRSQIDYTIRTLFPQWRHWTASYTPKGQFKARLQWIVTRLAILGLLAAIIWTTRNGQPNGGVRGSFRSLLTTVRSALLVGLDAAQKLI